MVDVSYILANFNLIKQKIPTTESDGAQGIGILSIAFICKYFDYYLENYNDVHKFRKTLWIRIQGQQALWSSIQYHTSEPLGMRCKILLSLINS